jgi:Plasmid pRiA4b ORF-3-like protein
VSPHPTVHQLRVTLCHVRPTVWRRLVVASDTTLGELSDILALSFGWGIDHLHLIQARGVDYGPPLPSSEWRDEDAYLLATVVPRPGAVAEYT